MKSVSQSVSQSVKFFSIVSLIAVAGCSTAEFDKFNKDLADFSAAIATTPSGTGSSKAGAPKLASLPPSNGKKTQLIVPSDKTVAQAMEAALPVVKKIVSIHQCTTDNSSQRLLNIYGVPGSNFQEKFRASPVIDWQYHDKDICPSVQVIDQWSMPAMNALTYRVIYFADDSGESKKFRFDLRKSPENGWQLFNYRETD